MFEALPQELRQHIYALHIDNCTWIHREEKLPYEHHQLHRYVPHKSAWLTVNRNISKEFAEQLSRHTRTARLHFQFFEKAVRTERYPISDVWGTHDATMAVMRGVRRVDLTMMSEFEFSLEVADAIIDGVVEALHYFKGVKQMYIWVESDYEKDDEDDEDDDEDDNENDSEDIKDRRTKERVRRAREHVQKIMEKTRRFETIEEISVRWGYRGNAEREFSRQFRKGLENDWKELDDVFEHPSMFLLPWVRWEFFYCQERHGFKTERRGRVPVCGHWQIG